MTILMLRADRWSVKTTRMHRVAWKKYCRCHAAIPLLFKHVEGMRLITIEEQVFTSILLQRFQLTGHAYVNMHRIDVRLSQRFPAYWSDCCLAQIFSLRWCQLLLLASQLRCGGRMSMVKHLVLICLGLTCDVVTDCGYRLRWRRKKWSPRLGGL